MVCAASPLRIWIDATGKFVWVRGLAGSRDVGEVSEVR